MTPVKHRRKADPFALLLVLACQFGHFVDDLSAGQTPRPETTPQVDAWIDSLPLISMDQEAHPFYGVVGAVFYGDTLIVAERSTGTLRYYDRATGKLHRTVGGSGEGPGEQQLMLRMQSVGDRIYTYDLEASRVTVFNLAGEVERTVLVAPWGAAATAPQVVGFFPDGSMLAIAMVRDWDDQVDAPTVRRDTWTISRHDQMGNFVDSLGEYLEKEVYVEPFGRGGERMGDLQVPFVRDNTVGVVGDDYFVLDNMASAIPVFDQTGELRHELGLQIRPEPQRLSREDARRFREEDEVYRQVPEFYPYYFAVRYVAGALWVLNYPVQTDVYSWTVFAPEGGAVGRVRTSERLVVLDLDGDIAAVLRVDELGVESVELRRIVGWD